jgi:hypothetical protein
VFDIKETWGEDIVGYQLKIGGLVVFENGEIVTTLFSY